MPDRLTGERQVLAVCIGAVMFAAMMVEVRVINKRRYQKRNATQQIPNEAKQSELAVTDVDQLVDEQDGSVKEDRRDQEPRNSHWPMPGRIGHHELGRLHYRKEKEPKAHAEQKVGPVEPGVRLKKFADNAPRLRERKIRERKIALGPLGSRFSGR